MAARGRARGAADSPCGSGGVALDPAGPRALVAAMPEASPGATEQRGGGFAPRSSGQG